MNNEETKVEEIVDETEEVVEDDEIEEVEDNDTTDWKAVALRNQGIAKRLKTKLEKSKTESDTVKKTESAKNKGFGLVEKTFLKASGISSNEFDFVREYAESSGIAIDELVEKKWFQNELKEFRDSNAVKVATPSGTRRSGASPRDSVDYWIAKGELPPKDQPKLRRDVVNARLKQTADKSKFTNDSVIS